MKGSRTEKLVHWFMFSVLISLVPLAMTYFSLRLDGKPVHLEMLLARGELLLICATLGAAPLGDLILAGRDHAIGKLVASGALILVIMVSSFYFATIQSRATSNVSSIVTSSVALFAGMLITSASCLYYGHQEVT